MPKYKRAIILSHHKIAIREIEKHIASGRFSLLHTEKSHLHSFIPMVCYHVMGDEFEALSDREIAPSYEINLSTLELERTTPPICPNDLKFVQAQLEEHKKVYFSIEPEKRRYKEILRLVDNAKQELNSINRDILEAKKRAGKLYLTY